MVSAGVVVGAVAVLGSVATAIITVRRLLGRMNAVGRHRRDRIMSRYRLMDGFEDGGLRMELLELEIRPEDDRLSKAKWSLLGEIVSLDGYADVVARLTAPDIEDDVLKNHFLADRLDIFEGLRVSNGSVEERDDGTVRLEFRIPSADTEEIDQILRDVHERALIRSFND